MASEAFEAIAEEMAFLDDWEDRYRHVIDLGRAMTGLPEADRTEATKVQGCASQVWLVTREEAGRLRVAGDSDAMIVRGLVAIVTALFDGLPLPAVGAVDARAELGRLGLNDHLSSQRSNGLRAMVARLQSEAAALAGVDP